MAARGRGLVSLYIYIEKFKNLLVRNHWTDFNIILQKCSFGDALPRLFETFRFVKKYGHQGAALIFPIYLYRKLQKSTCPKPLDRFQYNFAETFLLRSSTKIVQAIWIRQKTWPPGLFSLYIYIKNFKNLLVRNHWTDFHIILQNVPLVILLQDCSSHLDSSKNMDARGRALFSLYNLYRKL